MEIPRTTRRARPLSAALVAAIVAGWAAHPDPAFALDFYVDAATGDDTRSPLQAQTASTPWATISHALDTADTSGGRHTIHVQAGTYPESPGTSFPNVEVKAVGGSVVIQPPSGGTAFDIGHADVTVEGMTLDGGGHGVRAENADGLVLRGCTSLAATSDGFLITNTAGVTIENSRVSSAGGRGIYLEHTAGAYLRNNQVDGADEWGIEIDANGGPVSTGNVVAFNTVVGSGAGTAAGGIRLRNATAEVRDNVVANNSPRGIKTDTAGTTVHHNDVFGSATPYESASGKEPLVWNNLSVDPGFVGGSDYRLTAGSPLVGVGSGDVADVDISGSATESGAPDTATADLGFHVGAGPSTGVPPPAPTVPGTGPVHYVDCQGPTALDSPRTKAEAQNPATPWKTIRYAVMQLGFGDVVEVAGGTCSDADEIEITTAGVAVRAATSRGTTIVPKSTVSNAFLVEADLVTLQGFVIQTDKRGVLVAPTGAEDLQDVILRDLEVAPGGAPALTTDKITVRDAVRAIVENSEVRNGIRGVLLRRTRDSYVRNNRISGARDWGIHVDDASGVGDAAGNVVAFNTVTGNGTLGTDGGIRFQSATGEIRDNIVASNSGIGIKTDKAPVYVHHNDVFGQPTPFDSAAGQEPIVWSNIEADPLFVGGDQRLAEVGAEGTSPALNAGSGPVGSVDISGTTRSDSAPDDGIANLGFHHDASASAGVPSILPPPFFTYYVDAAIGSDTRSKEQARNPATPWATIGKALASGSAASGDTVVVNAGTYAESATSTTGMISVIASGAVTIVPPAGEVGLRIDHPGFLIDGVTITGGLHGIRAANADGLVIRGCHASGQSRNGLMVVDTSDVTLENNVVHAPAQRGIFLDHTDRVYVRNNAISQSGEWGIEFDAAGGPTSADNVVAFNTVYGGGALVSAGGIRFRNATGEIRDNVLSMNAPVAVRVDTAPSYVHHNVLHASTPDILTTVGEEPVVWSNRHDDPLLVDPASGVFALSHVDLQGSRSPAIDRGSTPVSAADISGSTRTDLAADTDTADPGFHSGAGASTGAPPVQTEPTSSRIYFVDPVGGNDAYSTVQAQSPDTSWRTASHAVNQAVAGDAIHLLPGTYAEQVSIDVDSLKLVGTGPLGTVVITPPAGQTGISITGPASVHVENLVIEGGSQGVRAENADGLRLVGVVAVNQSTVGLHVVDTSDAWVDGCIVTGAGTEGISLERSDHVYVRNNLVYANAEWGISLDNTTPSNPQPALSTGNAVAFNTVHANGDGIRMLNVSGEVRDNQITGQVDLGLYLDGLFLLAHHNNFASNGRDRDRNASLASFVFVWSSLGKNPRYVDPDGPDGVLGGAHWQDDDFRLQRQSAGEDYDSPSIDAGSASVGGLDISGSTASTGEADTGTADVGRHYGAAPGVAIPAFASIPSQTARIYYVSPIVGDDTRTSTQARSSATPWQTLGHALQQASAGDTVIALPGVYPEAASVERANLTLRSSQPGEAVIQPPSGTALSVTSSGVTIDGFVLRSASTGIQVTAGADDVHITNCATVDAATDGIRATDVSGLIVENSISSGNTFSGIALRRVLAATIRNNLLYVNGEWGLSHDNLPDTNPLSADNLVAHNTAAHNGLGNVRLLHAVGVVRDNLFTDTPGVGLRIDTPGAVIHHNGFHANATPLDPETYLFCAGCTANETVVPSYVDPTGTDGILGGNDWTDDDFRLSQIASGQLVESEAVDFGSASAVALSVNGSTATTGTIDDGIVDLGYHYDSSTGALPAPSYSSLPLDVLYVDAALGDDGRSRAEANSPSTPWQTLSHALGQAVPGDILLVAPGVYPESLRVDVENVTIRGDGAPGATILEPSGPLTPVPPRIHRDGIRVRATGVRLDNLWIRGARRAITTQGAAAGLTIEDVRITESDRDGIVIGADDASISGVSVSGSRRYGVYVRRASGIQVRDSELYDNGRTGLAIIRSEATLAFVTSYGNRDGIRSAGNTLTLSDSIVAGNQRYGYRGNTRDVATVVYTLFGLNGRGDLFPASFAAGAGVQTGTDPLFVDPDAGDLTLAGGSPAIDAGSDLASNLGVTGSATGGAPDTGLADLGAHR